jgi:hypothetical protein
MKAKHKNTGGWEGNNQIEHSKQATSSRSLVGAAEGSEVPEVETSRFW